MKQPPPPLDPESIRGRALLLYARGAFGSQSRIEFYRQLKKLLESKLRLIDALALLYARSARRSALNPTAIALGDIWLRVEGGERLPQAVGPWVPPYERQLIAAGDEAGRPIRALELCVRVIEGGSRISAAIRKGTAYPATLFFALIAILVAFSNFLMPRLREVADPSGWDSTAGMVRDIASFVDNWLIVVLGVLLTASLLALSSLPRLRGKIRVWLERFPPWSLYRMSRGATFLLSLAAFLEAGVKLSDALAKLRTETSPWLEERIDLTMQGIDEGMNLGEALDAANTDFPSRNIIDEMIVYAELEGFDTELARIGEDNLGRAVEEVEKAMGRVRTMMMILVFGLLSIMVSGVFDLQQQIARQAEGLM